MSRITQADFYYGAVLSTLLNHKITPAYVESNQDSQIYDFSLNHVDFRLYAKYTKDRKNTTTKDYNSWQFGFSKSEIEEIKDYLEKDYNLVIVLVCGMKNLNESEIAVLDKEQIQELIGLNKESISISRKKNERYYRISIGGGRDNSIQIKANKFEELFMKKEEAEGAV